MKKFFVIPFFLVLISCADNDNTNNTTTANNTLNNKLIPLFSENKIVIGDNQVNYDKTKTFNTLLYSAQIPATDSSYTINNTYTISANNQNAQNVQAAKTLLNTNPELAARINIDNDKRKIIDINEEFTKYAFENKLKAADKNSSGLYKTMPQTVTIGTKWENINLLDINTNSYSTISATCIAVSDHAYFFLQDGLDNLTTEQITAITTSFDKDYEIIHQYYGVETDTDGNGKVSFLIVDISHKYFGFFYTPDKYMQQDIPAGYKSNEADVLYINHYYFINGWEEYQTDLKATFIHEFQHMVHFDTRMRLNLNSSLDLWLNEGLSMLSEYYGGYAAPHYRYVGGYFAYNQGISLITDNSSLDYGLSYLFARYLQIRFGDGFIKKLYSSQYSGIKAVEEVTNMDFNELFLDFIKMIFVTGRGVTDDPKYNIEEFNHPQGSEGYDRNGFNLAALIDEVYSLYKDDNTFIASTSYTQNINMYGFYITKWNGNIDNITLSGNENIAGMYQAW